MTSAKYLGRFIFLVTVLNPFIAFSQVLIKANITADTYELVRSKGLKLEVPDCVHPVKHVSQVWDNELREYVFVFNSHVNLDNDRCRNFDRIRTEMTITDSVPPLYLAAHDGDTFTYSWKFKLDSGFVANPSFCHIHQIKAVGGDDGAPIITLTTRAGTPDMLKLIYTPPRGSGDGATLKETGLSQFKGIWVNVNETVTFNVNGKYSIIITRISDGDTLFSYFNNNIRLSRPRAYFYRPKIGIYRSLKNKSEIRDESVRYADFGISKGSVPCVDPTINDVVPAVPTRISATAVSGKQIIVNWYDNSYNEDHFRIERSKDEIDWSLVALFVSGWERWKPQTLLLGYVDSSLQSATKYFYRVRAENLFGYSAWSIVTDAITQNTKGTNLVETIPDELILQCYPNPFNYSTKINYEIPIDSNVRLTIYDSLGKKRVTIIDEFEKKGKHTCIFNANNLGKKLTKGTYFARLKTGEYARILKLTLLK